MKLLLGLIRLPVYALAAGLFLFLLRRGLPAASWSVLPPLAASLLTTALGLALALPAAVGCGVYLAEHPAAGLPRLCIRTLAGLPSVLFGLFGLVLLVPRLGWSLLSGSVTLALMAMPVLVTGTEAAILSAPRELRQSALALGAGRGRLYRTILLPLVGRQLLVSILSLYGRLMGESAALLLTAGTVFGWPTGLLRSCRTLPVHIYLLLKESGDSAGACWAGVVLAVTVAVLTLPGLGKD